MPDRQTFQGRLIQSPAKSGDPHVIELQSTMVKAVDEAVKSAMEGSDDLQRFVVASPAPVAEKPVRGIRIEDRNFPDAFI